MRGKIVGVLGALTVLALLLLPTQPAAAAIQSVPAAVRAQSVGEHISSYDVALSVHKDGELDVKETIAYDFADLQKHGIYRYIPERTRYDDKHDRVYTISDFHVSSPDGAPTQVDTSHSNGNVVYKIGDPGQTVTGTHTYVLSYHVGGAIQRFADHAELNWNAIGTGFAVPIDQARVTLAMPVDVTKVACSAGAQGSRLPCASATMSGTGATYSATGLGPDNGVTIVAAVPRSALPDTVQLERHFDLAYFLSPSVGALAGLLVVVLLGGGLLGWLLWSRGRDRRYVDQILGLSPAQGQQSVERHRPLFSKPDGAVEFAPPDNIRPGQVGTIIDEQANVVDVTATIIDLAVRGYLHIDEIEPDGRFGQRDWGLRMLKAPGPELLPYEKALFDALFLGKPASVRMSELKYTFAANLADVQSRLYDDSVAQGWFARRPDYTRRGWHVVGVAVLVVAVVASFLLYKAQAPYGLIGVGLILLGLAALVTARYMPAKTAKGSAVLARVLGFRQYIRTAEAEQLRFEEREQIFSRYLPYAIVFGETDRWAKAFASLGQGQEGGAGSGLYWYSGPASWNLLFFAASMNSFTTTSAGVLASAPPSSSGGGGMSGFGGGGFSGGGGGGGGGGSW